MDRLKHAFRERQIYVRSEGKVRFVTFRPWLQITLCAMFVGAIVWIAGASINVATSNKTIAAKDRHANELTAAYEQRLEELRNTIDSMNDKLMVNQDAYMAKVRELEEIQHELEERHHLLKKVMKGGDISKSTVPPKPVPKKRSSLDADDPKSHAEAQQPIDDMRHRIAVLEDRQRDLLDAVERNRSRQAEAIERTIKKLGLRPSSILSKTKVNSQNSAMGGPFIAFNPLISQDRSLKVQLKRINRYLNKIAKYQTAVSAMPIARPLPRRRRITSGYGVRTDPIKKVAAMHSGIDFRAPQGASVRSTAAGRVVRAGTHAGYGNLVVVRHNHGISTRYAHLSRIDVKVGQQVGVNQKLGQVGSTGRSTGPHLHYEIRIFGKAIDPRRIWRAGHNVLKAKDN